MLPRAKKASSKHSSSKSFQFWDPDVVIVFDPAEQKLFKGSRAKIETGESVQLPPADDSRALTLYHLQTQIGRSNIP